MKLPEIDLLHVSLAENAGARPVGRLARVGHRILFEYDAAFVRSGLDLSPFHLPLREGVHEEKARVFDGLFGVFHDSLPDGWGRLLVDREVERRGGARASLTPLHRLAIVGERGMGALVYRPLLSLYDDVRDAVLDLDALAAGAARVLAGASADVLATLGALGGSSGGARPKVLVGWRARDDHLVHGAVALDDATSDELHEPWIVKFRAREDPDDMGFIEHAYATMAREGGLAVAPSRMFGNYFGARRFDRDGRRRIHVHSVAGLLHVDHRLPGSLDYVDVARAAWALTRDQREVERVFRNAVFNVLAHNRDDHPKNFAFRMASDGTWGAAPAFDLTFAEGPAGEHWLTVAGEGRAPTLEHLLMVAKAGGIVEKRARVVVDEVRAAVARWPQHARRAGVGKASAARIKKVIAPSRAR